MVYFSDYFNLDEQLLEDYGAFNISLINDLPLFIDPFLLFGSNKNEYQKLHSDIIKYLTFLKNKSKTGSLSNANIKSWYKFSEVKQNWFGYSLVGNGGSGLGKKFGKAMSANMHIVYDDLNNEKVTVSSHLEKAGLFQIGVGKDNISDFTCNLIKGYIAEYTEKFALKHLESQQVKVIMVDKIYFDYTLEKWMPKQFTLPFINGDFVFLTPKDLLTKDDNWINSNDLRGNFESICTAVPNDQLRSEIHNYFRSKIPPKPKKKRPSQKELTFAINETIKQFPEILKYYIKLKEENKVGAKHISQEKVEEVENIFIKNVSTLIGELIKQTKFYQINPKGSFKEALERVEFLKDVIENKDGYRLFYSKGKAIKREADLQIIYRLTWHATPFDVNREVNNGRGPVDYTVSNGSKDKTLVEFKLASNSKLKMNLKNQVGVYEAANNTSKSIKVIMYFDLVELAKVNNILKELELENNPSIVLIDACNNKPSGSNVK
ncbi:hypothetical protein M0D21_10085 [Aquimarina sp. D1M17]|uniref:hypothetical protein n=1 Tax=Aquimarina acroporae TaxID=2937283 RepID=UPI0020BD5407|nr:hypothetical protein [Aquimarina acroporae]MCK8521917.1 hypothetical protein [Aquimarina acroporae]